MRNTNNYKPFPYLVVFTALFITIMACSPSPENKSVSSQNADTTNSSISASKPIATTSEAAEVDYDLLFKIETYLTDSAIVEDSIQDIDYDCALLVYPTQTQIDAMIAKNGEEDFYTIADDNSYYHAMAIEKIDSAGITKVSAERPFIRFKGAANTWLLDIRRPGLPEWNIIFFHQKKEPQIISEIDLTTAEAKKYFDITR